MSTLQHGRVTAAVLFLGWTALVGGLAALLIGWLTPACGENCWWLGAVGMALLLAQVLGMVVVAGMAWRVLRARPEEEPLTLAGQLIERSFSVQESRILPSA